MVLDKCHEYGLLMHHLNRGQAEGLFWGLFGFVIILLITAGLAWTSSERIVKKIKEAETDLEKGYAREDLEHKKKQLTERQYITVAITSVSALAATVATIMEAFAALTLEYCDGEDLMQFYWGFWTLIQVGSVIAMIGLAAYHYYSLNDKDHPPWMVALGTPVLVIAGLGHMVVLGVRTAWRKFSGYSKKKQSQVPRRGSSTSMILRRSNTYKATILGFRNDGEVILHFPDRYYRPPQPNGTELLGFDPVDGGPILLYKNVYPEASRAISVSSGAMRQVVTVEDKDKSPPQQAAVQEHQPSTSGEASSQDAVGS